MTLNNNSTTLIRESELFRRVAAAGLDPSRVCVIAPRWAEIAPEKAKDGAKSELITCDLIIRSDGTAVGLDGCMGMDSMAIARHHAENYDPSCDWDSYVASLRDSSVEIKS